MVWNAALAFLNFLRLPGQLGPKTHAPLTFPEKPGPLPAQATYLVGGSSTALAARICTSTKAKSRPGVWGSWLRFYHESKFRL